VGNPVCVLLSNLVFKEPHSQAPTFLSASALTVHFGHTILSLFHAFLCYCWTYKNLLLSFHAFKSYSVQKYEELLFIPIHPYSNQFHVKIICFLIAMIYHASIYSYWTSISNWPLPTLKEVCLKILNSLTAETMPYLLFPALSANISHRVMVYELINMFN
jgi:hypothetical protein